MLKDDPFSVQLRKDKIVNGKKEIPAFSKKAELFTKWNNYKKIQKYVTQIMHYCGSDVRFYINSNFRIIYIKSNLKN